MNQRERAQRMVALLTQAFEADWSVGNTKGEINVFEGDVVARIELPETDDPALKEAYARCAAAGFHEGLKFIRTVIDLVAVTGKVMDELHPEVDFRSVLHRLGYYAAALPDNEE